LLAGRGRTLFQAVYAAEMTKLRKVVLGTSFGLILAGSSLLTGPNDAASALTTGAKFVGIAPTRALDTRGTTPLAANVARQVPLTMPSGVVGVSANLTITRASGNGFATVHPCSQTNITTSTVNFQPGIDIANASPQTPLDSSGLCVTADVKTDVIVDVTGWWSSTSGTALAAHNPTRLIDSRDTTTRPLVRTIPTSGGNVVGLTVIVTRPAGNGFASVHPCTQAVTTSNVNFRAGQTVTNLVVMSAASPLCITTSVAADVVIDEVASAGSNTMSALPPTRLLDTRDTASWVGAGGTVTLPVGSARTVLLNVTAVRPFGAGFMNVWPCSEPEPKTSALSWSETKNVATAVVARADSSGYVCLRPSVGTHVLADVLGSDQALPTTITPAFTGRTNELVLGQSVQGRPIIARAYGTGDGTPVLGVGVIHGDEQSGLAIVADLKQAKVPAGVEMWLIDSVNPDGMALNTRKNANEVDLNRNWPTNWQPIARSNNYSGTGPASEPETKATLAFINLIKPVTGVWWHTVGDYVDDSRSSVAKPDLITNYANFAAIGIDDAPCLGFCGGTATQHINATLKGATHMVVELPSPLSAAGAQRHANAFLAIAAAS
jgi:murein peptide amidase A